MKPTIGDEATCEMCKREIYFDGKTWVHKDFTPRHPAAVSKDHTYGQTLIVWPKEKED